MKILIDIPLEVQQDLIKVGLYHGVDVAEAVVHYLVLGLAGEKENNVEPFNNEEIENDGY